MPREPHLLLATGNLAKMIRNITPVISAAAVLSLQAEIDRNVQQMFKLGEDHFRFAKLASVRPWRQKVSRFYYAGFTVSRALRLHVSGDYSSEVDDHKKFDRIPDDFPRKATYASRLSNLRSDRNTADYDHTATQIDLLHPLADTQVLITDFVADSRAYLRARGIMV